MDAFLFRLRFVLPLALVNTGGYLLANHCPLFVPHQMTLTPLDRAIPFLTWTIWPYLLLILADFLLPFMVQQRATFDRMLVAYGVAMGANFLFWIFLPTAMTRPVVADTNSLSVAAYHLLVAVDAPANSFPSGHVTIPAVGVWAVAHDWGRLRIPLWIGLSLLSLSILTTKQHTVADLFGGYATALLGIAISGRIRTSGSLRHA